MFLLLLPTVLSHYEIHYAYLLVHAMTQTRVDASPCAVLLEGVQAFVLYYRTRPLKTDQTNCCPWTKKIDLLVLNNCRAIICIADISFTSTLAVPCVVLCLAFSFLGSPFADLGNGPRPDVQQVLLSSCCISLIYLCQNPL